jgi:DNA-binding transcriptional MerR regulator
MNGLRIRRLYYSTTDVSEIAKVQPHVLRSWESKFPNLNPSKSKSGRRLFRQGDLDLVLIIKKLKDEGYTEEKIRNLIKYHGREKLIKIELLHDREKSGKVILFFEIYSGLKEILKILNSD